MTLIYSGEMNTTVLPKKGEIVPLTIESLAFGGKGISHIGGMVVFVKNAIPGQLVNARILKKRKTYLEALAHDVINESQLSEEISCTHHKWCGGCTFQNLKYEEQLKAKQLQVKEIFHRIGRFDDFLIKPILPSEDVFHYRNKMEFTFSNRRWITDEDEHLNRDFALGLHVPGRFDKIYNIDQCSLQLEIGNQILNKVKNLSFSLNLEPYDIREHTGFLRHLVIRCAKETGEVMVNFVTSKEKPERLKPIVEEITKNYSQVVSIVNNINTKKAGIAMGEWEIILHGKDFIVEKLGNYEFEISANSFFQTNTRQGKRLYDVVKDECNLTGNEIVYDLFCGTGSISIYLSEDAKMVHGFELINDAVINARQNAIRNNVKNAWFYKGDLMDIFQNSIEVKDIESPDVMVIDPPRAGIHKKTIPHIIEKNPERIVYVSCNPSSQARDIQLLCGGGYKLMGLQPVDMFPHTPHVENVATLTKNN